MTDTEPLRTSVEGRQRRPRTTGMFDDITDCPVLETTEQGVLFDGELTDEQVGDVWWRWTSSDDTDELRRRTLAELLASSDPDLCAALVNYVLGTEAP